MAEYIFVTHKSDVPKRSVCYISSWHCSWQSVDTRFNPFCAQLLFTENWSPEKNKQRFFRFWA